MAINRFDRPGRYDFSWKSFVPNLPMPNFEAWNEMLSTQQQGYDTAIALTEKMPKYLQTEQDRELLGQYKGLVDNSLNDITTAYQEQGVTAGNRLLRDKTREILKQWQPGGTAAALEDRYTAYQSALGEIQKGYEKDARGINKQFATYNLQKQLEEPINYDPATGEYRRISTPELYTDPNIQKLTLDAIKEIEESGSTQIVRQDPFWFQKIKTLGRSPEALKMVAEAIYEQYPQQVAIESWYRSQGVDPEAARAQ